MFMYGGLGLDDSFVNKDELLRRLDERYEWFDVLLERAAAQDTDAAGVTEEWSVKDVVAHLIAHEQRSIDEIRAAQQGRTPEIKHDENDSFNDGAVFAWRASSFEQVRKAWQKSFQQVVQVVQALTDADFDPNGAVVAALGDTIDGGLANNTYEHYDFHGVQIAAWLERITPE